MGCTQSSSTKAVTHDAIYDCISSKNFKDMTKLLQSLDKKMSFHKQMSIWHYVVVYSIFYNEVDAKKLCEILKENYNVLPNIKKPTVNAKCYIEIKKDSQSTNYSLNWHKNDHYYNPNTGRFVKYQYIFKFNNLTPLALAFELKLKFISNMTEFVNCGLDIVIDFIMKLEALERQNSNKSNTNLENSLNVVKNKNIASQLPPSYETIAEKDM
jgi:outer membrane protein assembly factor BamA